MTNKYDATFLQELTEYPHRTIFVRLTLLDLDDNEIETIGGRATGGSINIDGASALRRTCNISLAGDLEKYPINNYLWTLSSRFRVEIGLINEINSNYEKVIWFKQGTFVITDFSCSLSVNNYSLDISGQDKMALLNGQMGGVLTAETDFAQIEEEVAENEFEIRKLTLYEIIYNIVHIYAHEPNYNIYIDLPNDSGVNLLEYRGDNPAYLLLQDGKIQNIVLYGDQEGTTKDGKITTIAELPKYWIPANMQMGAQEGTAFIINGQTYQVRKIEYGDLAGYEKTDLTYAGELKAAVGESVVSVLDKIKNMLGEYEYFYDVNGKFIFQQKKTYVKTIWNNGDTIKIFENGEYSYIFDDLSYFTSFSNSPDIKNVKNDYSVWGLRKSVNGNELPIHMRLAIDNKPTSYTSPYSKQTYGTDSYDYRELIYQMALDFFRHGSEANFGLQIQNANSSYVRNGRTGYEQYYTDLQGFWRDLYNPNPEVEYKRVNVGEATHYYSWESLDSVGIDKVSSTEIARCLSGYYIPWLETLSFDAGADERYVYFTRDGYKKVINSTDSPLSLRHIYSYNATDGEYHPVLDQNNTINRNTNYATLLGETYCDLFDNSDWCTPADKDKMYWKKVGEEGYYAVTQYTNFESLLEEKDLETLANNSEGIFYYDSKAQSYKVLSMLYKNGSSADTVSQLDKTAWRDIQDWYKDTTQKRQFNTVGEDGLSGLIDLNYNTRLAVKQYIKKESTEGETWIPYIYYNDEYVNYAVYLSFYGTPLYDADGSEIGKQYLDEYKLYKYSDDGYKSIARTIPLDRNSLATTTTVAIGEGEDVKQIICYKKLKDQLQILIDSGILNSSTLYCPSSDIKEIPGGGGVERFEYYYLCDNFGELVNTQQYARERKFYKEVSDYAQDHWHKNVHEHPDLLTFWFELLTPRDGSQLAEYAVNKIGNRNLAETKSEVTGIYYESVPDMYYGQILSMSEPMRKLFVVSSQGQSAYSAIDDLLYNHTYVTEGISINSIPIYHLEPNTKIFVKDKERGIEGDYIVDRLSIPLSYSGTMSITATRAPMGETR